MHGISGPPPEDVDVGAEAAAAYAHAVPFTAPTPDYPLATFMPAASVNYTRASRPRTVDRIVIHITDGGSRYMGTVNWFQNPNQRNSRGNPIRVSSHYVVGQGGEVVQMVPHADIAHHASQANRRSIGIEHTARVRSPRRLPTEDEYRASACLVRWLCQQYGLPADREHIVGHHEISPRDGHTECPAGAWDWDHYMDLVANATCDPPTVAQGLGYGARSLGYAPVRMLEEGPTSFSVNWDDVQLIAQPTGKSCWATAAAMVIGWRDQMSVTPELVAQIAGRTMQAGLAPSDRRRFAADVGLMPDPPQSYSIQGLRDLLEINGPFYVSVLTSSGTGHAVVVTGMYSDGNLDGSDTFVRISDPWDRVVGTPGHPGAYLPTHATGSRYILTWDDFVREYELRATSTGTTVDAQILHSGSNFGRQPNRSGAVGYAQSLGARLAAAGQLGHTYESTYGYARPLDAPPPAQPAPPAQPPIEVPPTAIAGNHVISRQGSVDWDLAQFDGLHYPDGDQQRVGPEPFQHASTIRLDDWPYIGDPQGARIQAAFAVDWEYNGRSLGRVRIQPADLHEMAGHALSVRATVTPDRQMYPPGSPTFAAIRVLFEYVFTTPAGTHETAMTELYLYGNGSHDRGGAWK